jgi:hypothetical protein
MTDTPQSPSFDFIVDAPPTGEAAAALPNRRTVFAGYTGGQLLIGAALVGVLVWGMWVTRTLTASPEQRIVKANLSAIVGDYVQAQARSASSPEDVQAQMRAFMSSLDGELQRRSDKGQVVLVGEAVLSKGVQDITPDVMKAVYASGIKRPAPASPEQMSQMLKGAIEAQAPQGQMAPQAAAPTVPSGNPMAAAPEPSAFGPMPAPAMGASVSSFGGPDGVGGQ